MTDLEMLELCLEAFEAVPTAAASRRFLTKHALAASAHYAGSVNASYRLARTMQHQLRQHLNLKED